MDDLNPDIVLRVIEREVIFQTIFPAAVRALILEQRSGDCPVHGVGQLIVDAPVYHHVDCLDTLRTEEVDFFRCSHFLLRPSRNQTHSKEEILFLCKPDSEQASCVAGTIAG